MCISAESRLRRLPSCFLNIAQFFTLSIALIASSVKAEIRCYCNQPTCVSTGYMCKSNAGSCFTELYSYSNDLSRSRHGCVELLKPDKKVKCTSPTTQVLNLPVVFCCNEDMCNYMNTMDINIQVKTRNNVSKSSGAYDLEEERRAYEAALQQDVWFKAAVIAVPIAGGFILILLILLASRMLRQDSRRQRQLLELRRQHQRVYGKQHILVAQPCCSRSANLVAPNCGKQNLSYANSNLTVSTENWFNGEPNDRRYLYDKSLTERTSICETLLPWSKWNQSKPSTHV